MSIAFVLFRFKNKPTMLSPSSNIKQISITIEQEGPWILPPLITMRWEISVKKQAINIRLV